MKKLVYIFLASISLQNVFLKAMEGRGSICTEMQKALIKADLYFGLHVTGLTPRELVSQAHKVGDPVRIQACKEFFPKQAKKNQRLIEGYGSPTSVTCRKHFKSE